MTIEEIQKENERRLRISFPRGTTLIPVPSDNNKQKSQYGRNRKTESKTV